VLTLIAALIAAGAVLAGFGTVGFCLVATNGPSRADLAHARKTATAGRWLIAAGVLLLWTSPLHVAGIGGLAVTLAICIGTLSLLTKSPIHRLAAA
jgi:hypothetical protein